MFLDVLGCDYKQKMLFMVAMIFFFVLFYYFLLYTVCTPLGFVRLFGVVGQVLVKPHLLRDVNEEYNSYNLEEAFLKRKLNNNSKHANHANHTKGKL